MVSYKQHALEERWDAIVIGSGIGGLATAALLSKHAGKRVLVLERHYTAGGYTHAFHRPGYQWDVGVHYIGEVHNPASQLRALFNHLSDGQLQWQPMPVIEQSGGQVVVSAEVGETIIKSGKAAGVRMTDRREFYSDIVISDAGARNTFERLVRAEQPLRSELRRIPPSMAHLSLYVGVKQSAAELGLNGTNLWVHPTPDHDTNFARFVKDPSAPFGLLFISFPSAKDPDFERKYPGRATLEVVTLAPYDWFVRWEGSRWKRRAEDYQAFKKELATRLQSELERLVPAVAGKIDHAELSTPLSTRHFMNYERGEAYGLAATPERFISRSLTPHTSVPGLYLTGQDVAALGVAGALFGGVATASAVLGKNLAGKIKPRTTAAVAA
jgi:all-trans-retinol 13,14-reductase